MRGQPHQRTGQVSHGSVAMETEALDCRVAWLCIAAKISNFVNVSGFFVKKNLVFSEFEHECIYMYVS